MKNIFNHGTYVKILGKKKYITYDINGNAVTEKGIKSERLK